MLNNAPTESELSIGGWSTFHSLTPQEKLVFKEALNGLLGVVYTPNTVSVQIVAGTNYRYRCIASIPPAMVIWEAIVEVFAPLEGKPYVTGIVRI